MEIQFLLTDQLTKIDVHGSAEAIPTRKSLVPLALDVPERIADILKIEFDAVLFQASSHSAPLAEKMAVRPPSRFVTVRTR
jgi:hypothetical protein